MGEALTELEWDVADRLRKALRFADLGVGEMADYLGVSRNTVGRYINGHARADRRTLRLWALRCGVPLGWLQTGETLPRMDSNHQPAGSGNDLEIRRRARPLTDLEIVAVQRDWRHLIRRGTFARSADLRSAELPTCEMQ